MLVCFAASIYEANFFFLLSIISEASRGVNRLGLFPDEGVLEVETRRGVDTAGGVCEWRDAWEEGLPRTSTSICERRDVWEEGVPRTSTSEPMLCRVSLTDTSGRVVLDKDGGGKGDFCEASLDADIWVSSVTASTEVSWSTVKSVSSVMGSSTVSSPMVNGGVSMLSIGSSGGTLVSGSFDANSFSMGCGGDGVEEDARGLEGVGVRGWEGERVWEEAGASSDGDSAGERNKSESSSLGRGVVIAREVVTREEGWEGA